MTRKADVAIVGGGLQGCATAFFLAARGASPMVIEKDYVSRHASGVNGGGVRTLNRHLAEVPLALASRRLWDQLPDLIGDDGGFVVTGQLRIAETEEGVEALRQRCAALGGAGYSHERLIGADDIRRLAPAVTPRALAALHVPTDGYASPYRVTTGFRHAAARKGASILEGVTVKGAERRGQIWRLTLSDETAVEAPIVINCAGAWAPRLAAMLGDALPIAANGSMQMVTARMPRFLDPVVGAVGRSMSVKQFPNGTTVIGGGRRSPVDLATNESSLNLSGLSMAMRDAMEVFEPLRRARVVRFWSGIEGFTPDHLPIVGAGRQEGVLHAAGFSAHGFQLGPIIGTILADLVTHATTDQPIVPFALERFTRQEQVMTH
jgi:sarcosine oxidase subunit beta